MPYATVVLSGVSKTPVGIVILEWYAERWDVLSLCCHEGELVYEANVLRPDGFCLSGEPDFWWAETPLPIQEAIDRIVDRLDPIEVQQPRFSDAGYSGNPRAV